MVRLFPKDLDAVHATALDAWQAEVDASADYPSQVAKAKEDFARRNTKTSATFRHVRAKLEEMCCGARRCAYCEDSMADEVEHMRPKDLYPGEVFSWSNYVYACGPCNGPKNNHFAVLIGRPGKLVDVSRGRTAPVARPASGRSALLDPRVEDPLEFLFLDIADTFAFVAKSGLRSADRLRAEYTLKVLRLNERDALIEARKNAFRNYRARLREYIQCRDRGEKVSAYAREFAAMDHRTVWQEMQRQATGHLPLEKLFAAAPEALRW